MASYGVKNLNELRVSRAYDLRGVFGGREEERLVRGGFRLWQ